MGKIVQLPVLQQTAQPKERRKKRADGLYQVESRYTAADGTPKKKSFYGKTQAEAQNKKKAFERDLELGLSIDNVNITVSQWVEKWLRMRWQLDQTRATTRTYDTYKRESDRLVTVVGKKRLRDVVKSDIQSIINSRAGMSKKAIKTTRNALKQIFKAAVDDRIITFSPCDGIVTPDGTNGSHRSITPEERNLITSTWQEHRAGIWAMLMLYAGLRRGEVVALDWKDIDINTGIIHVRGAVAYQINAPIGKDTKTDAGIRDLPIVKPLADALGSVTCKTGLVCKSVDGEQLTQSACERGWESYIYFLSVKQNGCHYRWAEEKGNGKDSWKKCNIRMHDLRHTYCTMLYDAGVDVKRAQYLMGHSSLDMTMKIYTHLSEERKVKSDKALHRYFDNVGKNVGKRKIYHLRPIEK